MRINGYVLNFGSQYSFNNTTDESFQNKLGQS